MNPRSTIYVNLLAIILVALTSCHPARRVEKRGGYLLVKNSIKTDNSYLPNDEIEGFIQQTAMPGRLNSFFRPGIWFYEKSAKGKQNGFKKFINRAFGKKPVILDTNLALGSVGNLQKYLKNKGFFHAQVSKTVIYRRITAKVNYSIHSGPPCIVTKFGYSIADSVMKDYILTDAANGKLREDMIFDTYVLDDERERIAKNLRNNSYYNFSLSDIYYLTDTTGLTADVEMHIKKLKIRQPGSADSIIEIQHPRYYIRDIYITSETDNLKSGFINDYDTIYYSYFLNKNDSVPKQIKILYKEKPLLKPSFLASALQFSTGQPYSQLATNQTYKKFITQSIIRSANIGMSIVNSGKIDPKEKQWLDCNLRITRNLLNTISLGTEGTNTGGRLGMGVNSIYQNRNIFRGAEVFSIKIRTSAELQANINNDLSEKLFLIFNTLEAGAEASIDFPRMLLPFRVQFKNQAKQARTNLSVGAAFEYRPEYKRNITTSAFSYNWQVNDKVKHIFTPLEINFVNITKSDTFQNYLNSLTDPQFKTQYTNHLLTMIRYSYLNTNIATSQGNRQYFLKANIETSGNVPFIYDKLTSRITSDEGYYEHFGIRYSQFVRFDVDFRRYWKLRTSNSIILRVMAGYAKAYGNTDVVPFEKSFWLGGANDMRGWRLRSLGPGEYKASDKLYDQAGDIMLQSSIEHRFPIYNFLLGCIFVDAGNIWLSEKSSDFEGGEFKFDTFAKQIAMDVGFGLRFDFSFFVFRLDWALPFHNPARNDSWFNPDDFKIKKAVWNFGIGYPF